jgi:GT2 family glycosyltransferase
MRIGIVVPIFLEYPDGLFESVRGHTDNEITWFLHSHSQDSDLELRLLQFCSENRSALVLHKENRGIAASWNDGIADAYKMGADVTLVVNDDITFHEKGLDEFANFLSRHHEFGLGLLHGYEAEGSPHHGQTRRQDFACFALGRLAFDRVGAFDENFFPAYCEDNDFDLRALRAGLTPIVDARTLVDHARNKTTRGSESLRAAAEEFKRANIGYYVRKWGGTHRDEKFASPFGDSTLGLKIPWSARRHPYGTHDRPELSKPQKRKMRLESFDIASTAADDDTIFVGTSGELSDHEMALAVRTAYLALLGREPESTGIPHYSYLIKSGVIDLLGMCKDIQRSSEYKVRTAEVLHSAAES